MVTLLTFDIDDRRLALRASAVREVVRAVAITRLPTAPAIVEGVVNVRGELLPVLDLRRRFRLPHVPVRPDQHFIIADSIARRVVLRVDRAEELIPVDESTIVPPSRVTPGADHVAGLVRRPDGLLVIHDLDGFLSLDEAVEIESALAAHVAGTA